MNDLASLESGQEPSEKPELTARQVLLQEIGRKLSQARETYQEPIEKPARKLKLQKRHLEAMESGNWEAMPDDVYVLGFLRQYSQYLNVDLSDEIHRLKNDQYTLTKPLTFPDPPVAPSRQWAWIAGCAFVLLFIVFNITSGNYISDSDETVALTPAPIETENPVATLPDLKPAETVNHDPDTIRPETILPAKETVTISPAPSESAQTPAHPETQDMASKHLFRFDAVGAPVWLQISLPNKNHTGKGRLLKEVLLQPGLHVSINAETNTLWITCGNATALRISVDGNIIAAKGSLGSGKKILRDYPFSIQHHANNRHQTG